MQILVNGLSRKIDGPADLSSLLRQLGYGGDTFAVAVNGDFVSRARYGQVDIEEGDTLDVVAPVVGG